MLGAFIASVVGASVVGTADPADVPTPSPDAPDAEIVPDVSDADTVPLEPTPPVEPEPVLPPPSAQPQTPPAGPELSAAAQVVVTSPGAQFRVGGGPYTVPVSIAGVSQLSTISLTLFFDPNVVRVRTVQEGSFMRQGGVQVTFTQQVDTAAGRVDITATRLNDATGAAGTGLLAAVQFDVVGVGSVTLSTSGTAMTPGGVPLALQFTPVTVTAQ